MFQDALQTRKSPKNIHLVLYAVFMSLVNIFCLNSRNCIKITDLWSSEKTPCVHVIILACLSDHVWVSKFISNSVFQCNHLLRSCYEVHYYRALPFPREELSTSAFVSGAERTMLMLPRLPVQIPWLISHCGWGDSISKSYSVCSICHRASFIDFLLVYLGHVSLSLKVREMILQQVSRALAPTIHPHFLLRSVFHPNSVWPNGWQLYAKSGTGAAHQRHTLHIMSALKYPNPQCVTLWLDSKDWVVILLHWSF